MKKLLSIIVFLFFGMSIIHAQTFLPDRPGIGNSSFITPEGMLGLETGFQFSNSDFIQQYDFGQLLLRYGVNENLEWRAFLGSYTSVNEELTGGDRTYTGFQDMAAGFKYNLFSGTYRPNISALAEVSLPIGTEEFTSDELVPSISLIMDHSLNENLSISSNLGYSFRIGNIDDNWLFTFTPGFYISNNMSGYFGYAGRYYNGYEEHWIESGVTFALNNGAQLDFNFGHDTENEVTFLGVGFAQGF